MLPTYLWRRDFILVWPIPLKFTMLGFLGFGLRKKTSRYSIGTIFSHQMSSCLKICFLIPSTWIKDSLTQRDYQLLLANLRICFPPKKILKGSLTAIAQACPGALWMHGRPDVASRCPSVAWCFFGPESQDRNKTK